MSGTSADGIDVALVKIAENPLHVTLEAFQEIPYSNPLRAKIQKAFSLKSTLYEMGELNVLIGEAFANAALVLLKKEKMSPEKIDFIGSHGQTVYHHPPSLCKPKETPFTLQLGDGSVIAERTGILTLSDFRVADVAAGGEGAPLVPYVDWRLFSHPTKARVFLNLGGIANFTYIPTKRKFEELFATDTGPANLLLDQLTHLITKGKRNYDQYGKIASSGKVNQALLRELMRYSFIHLLPPKSAERSQFGDDFIRRIKRRDTLVNLLTTLTAFTAESVAFHLKRYPPDVKEIFVSGGGSKNWTLMKFLKESIVQHLTREVKIYDFGVLGVPSKAKEAYAFAFLAYETLNGRPSNVPHVTGARKPCVLGKISPGWWKTWKLL